MKKKNKTLFKDKDVEVFTHEDAVFLHSPQSDFCVKSDLASEENCSRLISEAKLIAFNLGQDERKP